MRGMVNEGKDVVLYSAACGAVNEGKDVVLHFAASGAVALRVGNCIHTIKHGYIDAYIDG
jgi:hypothetical protein